MPLKKSLILRFTSTLLLLAFVANSFAAGAHAQEAQRDRRVGQSPATVSPSVAPSPTPSSTTTIATTTRTPAAPVAPVRTLEALRAGIEEVLGAPELAPATLGLKVVSLDTGRVLFEENAGKLLVPASNMKLYTVAAAFDRLGADYRFITSVYAQELPDKKGKLRGDLVLYGRGDPTFSTRFNGGDYFKAIDELAARIVAAGVRQVEGDFVGDESYFTGPPRSPGWEWDDLQWYYGADVSALTVNNNALDLSVKPGARAGDAGVVTTGPASPSIRVVVPRGKEEMTYAPHFLTFINRVTTAPRGAKRDISVHRPLGQNFIEVAGQIPEGDPGYTGSVAVARPALLFASMLRAALEKQGVSIKGRTRIIDAPMRPQPEPPSLAGQPIKNPYPVEIARRESPPFSEIAAQTLKPSDNLYTELILRALGKQFPSTDPKLTSAEAGLSVIRTFLNEAGVNTAHLAFVDGSGLARQNLITAESTVQLLVYMSKHRHAQAWRDAQPVAGVDGTLRGRMRNTVAAGNVRAKTGTLNNVSGLSGYVTSAAGERLAFSIIVNHYPDDNPPRQNYMDAIAVLLASFAAKSD
ncbi:MAG TPA: D-alanyl-D-alanine carboxypeptidase/D-alanyl-D-alanine-endopeptidase [Pyrinomonadaceae bacterium]|jgi:D-alanyl-D-alanine carboxypeptidase/D-alanyl-D-alanine-endopeptidase (penicillin-binding protein 4)|nr:D-alanyl-D-alanine carboxypeptidase/D-alanyl-D-alanine-endopeptidase [Pyrinomonadaceae bacterium]